MRLPSAVSKAAVEPHPNLAREFGPFIKRAAIWIWLRVDESVPWSNAQLARASCGRLEKIMRVEEG
jgi:hypothetical protein